MLWVKYKGIKTSYGILFVSLILNLIPAIYAQSRHSGTSHTRRRDADPLPNFFSELGGLFLDVDKVLADQTAPKVQLEDRLVSQILRPSNEYFNRIQENYKTVQNRLSKLIVDTLGPKPAYNDRELSTVTPPSAVEKEILTFTPVGARSLDISTDTKKTQASSGKEASSLDSVENECSGMALDDPFLEHLRKERCDRKIRNNPEERIRRAMEEMLLEAERAGQILVPLGSKTLDSISKTLIRRQGDIDSDKSHQQSKTMEDLMYSESTFDNQLQKLLKRHGQWLLDNPFLNRWRQSSETTTKISTAYPTETEISTDEATSRATDEISTDEATSTATDEISTDEATSKATNEISTNEATSTATNEISTNEATSTVINESSTNEVTSDATTEMELKEAYDLTSTESQAATLKSGRSLSDSSHPKADETFPKSFLLEPDKSFPESLLSKSEKYVSEIPQSKDSNYYNVIKDSGNIEEEVEIIFKPESHIIKDAETEEIEKIYTQDLESQDFTILAFTPDGIPLKLRIGPEIESPIRYLHGILKSAGVSLNIPVESFNVLEPVGKEVLKLGSGILMRAVYIDVSNRNELKTLLKSLMKLKKTDKNKY